MLLREKPLSPSSRVTMKKKIYHIVSTDFGEYRHLSVEGSVNSIPDSVDDQTNPDSKMLSGHRWLWVAKYSQWATTEPQLDH